MELAEPVPLGSRPVLIRDAREADLDDTGRMMVEAYREYEPLLKPDAWKLYAADIGAVRSRLDSAELIVCEQQGRLHGAVTFYRPGAFALFPSGWACFRLLAVSPQARGSGVGRALVDEAIARARGVGAEAMGIHNVGFMKAALALYDRLGFTREPRFDFQWPGAGRDGSPLTVNAYRLPLREAA
jgi:GNAT superfamily N-acetyltransferase